MNERVDPYQIVAADSLHDVFADILVAWGEYEERQPNRRLTVLNLIGLKTARVYQSREAVRGDMLQLHSGFLRAGDVSAAARIRSFLAYIDTLKDQSKYTLHEYYSRMTGLELKPFTPEEVAEAKKTLLACMRIIKPDFTESDFARTEDILHAAEPKLTEEEFLKAVKDAIEEDKAVVGRLTGLNPDVEYDLDIKLLANGNRAEAGWEKGRIRFSFAKQLTSYRLIAHEIDRRHEIFGHGLQTSRISEAVLAGKLPLSYGIMTTQGSEIMHSEAMAECISRLFVPAGEHSAIAEASHAFLMHRRMTGFNARLICHEKGDVAARAYLTSAAPYMKKRDIDVLMANMALANRPGVHYPLVYAPVHFALNRFAQAMGPDTFGKFIGEVLPTLKDAKGLNEAMERYSGSQRYNLPLAL